MLLAVINRVSHRKGLVAGGWNEQVKTIHEERLNPQPDNNGSGKGKNAQRERRKRSFMATLGLFVDQSGEGDQGNSNGEPVTSTPISVGSREGEAQGGKSGG